jgi:2-methylisocitrate lyase-like PEP mutase family enzyme
VNGEDARTGAKGEALAVFRALHRGRGAGDPLVLPGPWDAASARVFADAGFPALATPSHGVALSLGYADGETPADAMFAAVARIAGAVDVPVSADIETGYGLRPKEIAQRLREAGAVGCNLEDSVNGEMTDAQRQADWLAEVREAAGGELFVNARIDSHLRGVEGALEDASRRAELYAAAGAECVYPIGAPPEDIAVLSSRLDVPVNALAHPGASQSALAKAGAARITFGGGLAQRALGAVAEIARELREG